MVAAGAYRTRIGCTELELFGVHIHRVGRIAYDAATGGGKAHRAPCCLCGECATAVGIDPRIQQAQREVAAAGRCHANIAAIGLEHGAGVHVDMTQRCAGRDINGATRGADITLCAVALCCLAEDRYITATGVDGRIDGDGTGICTQVFNQHITRAQGRNSRANEQRADRPSTVAQQNGAVTASCDTRQGDFFA